MNATLELQDRTIQAGDVAPWLVGLADFDAMPAEARTICQAAVEVYSRTCH